MSRKSIQLFAFGWFAAACCMAGVYYLEQPELSGGAENPSAENSADEGKHSITEEEQISSLESSGYVVLTESKFTRLQEETNTEQQPASSSSRVKTMLHITNGMTSGEVSSLLLELNMIEDTQTFEQQLKENGAAGSIQPGVYELNNSMSVEDIIQRIAS